MVKRWLVLAAVLASPAWAQSDAEIDAALGPELQAYANCIKEGAERFATTTQDEQGVADRAFEACRSERQLLLAATQRPPIGYDKDKAEAEVAKADADLRPRVLETIRNKRGG